MPRRLALFDLDNTLLHGDSDHAFGEYLIARGLVDAAAHRAANDRFYQQYQQRTLNIHDYVRFTLTPVLRLEPAELQALIADYASGVIAQMVKDEALELVRSHQQAGDYCTIITATNSLLTTPLAEAFGVDTLLATDLEMTDGKLTGNISGIPCFQQGKVEKLQRWLSEAGPREGIGQEHSIFYSDSANDLPLLEWSTQPVVVNPDDKLAQIAEQRQWQRLDLFKS